MFTLCTNNKQAEKKKSGKQFHFTTAGKKTKEKRKEKPQSNPNQGEEGLLQ